MSQQTFFFPRLKFRFHLEGNHPPASTYHTGRKTGAEYGCTGYIVRFWRLNLQANIFNHEPGILVWSKLVVACPNDHNKHDIVCYVLRVESVSHLCLDSLDFSTCLGWVVQTPARRKHTHTHVYTHVTSSRIWTM